MNTQISLKAFVMLLAIVTFSCSILHAQRVLDIDEIQVVAPYEPTISDAFKINVNPAIEDTLRVEMDFDYSIQPQKIASKFETDPITPARMRGEPLSKLYRGHVKGGYGSYQTPYFEGFYNTLRSNQYALGVHLKHLSSGSGTEDHPHSVYSENKANIYGTRFFRNNALETDLLYNRQVVHYYGTHDGMIWPDGAPDVLPATLSGASDIRQRYEFLSSRAGFGSTHADVSKLQYHAGIGHQWLSDRHDGNEHHFSLKGNLGRKIGADPFDIADRQYFRMDMGADYYHHNNPTDTSNTGIYSIRPQLHSTIDRLQFHLGANLSVEDDNASYELRAYPLAGLEMELIPGYLVAHMAVSGKTEKQSWRKLSAVNPFVQPSPNMALTNVRSEIDYGVRGSFGDVLSFKVGLTHSNVDNYPLFGRAIHADGIIIRAKEGEWTLSQPFHVIYDNIKKIHLHAELFSLFGDRFSLRLRGDYFDYTLENQQKAWHKPDFLVSMNISYSIQDKIILTADLYGRDKAYGVIMPDRPPFMPVAAKLHDFYVDANLGIEYRYTKLLAVFLNFYNMQNESYERWLHYPTHGFSFLGGVSYSF